MIREFKSESELKAAGLMSCAEFSRRAMNRTTLRRGISRERALRIFRKNPDSVMVVVAGQYCRVIPRTTRVRRQAVGRPKKPA